MIELTFNANTLLITVTVIVAITFGLLLLFSDKSNPKADRYLAALLFIVAGWNISLLILNLNIFEMIIGIIWVPFSYTLALGPCLYFYVIYQITPDTEQDHKIWPHFVPMTVQVVLFFTEVFIAIPKGIGYLQTELYLVADPIINVLAIISLLVYGYFARAKILTYQGWVKDDQCQYHQYNVKWLFRLITIFVALIVVWFMYLLSDYFLFDYQLIHEFYYPLHLSLAAISIWLSVEAYTKPKLIDAVIEATSFTPDDQQLVVKEVTDTSIKNKADWLRNEIEINRLYLDPELSLKSLADKIDMHPNVLSKIINEGLGKSFSECINEYRVNAVIEKLSESMQKPSTFLTIAFDCGFNSKTTFNRIFKKHTGKTPQQYQATLKNS